MPIRDLLGSLGDVADLLGADNLPGAEDVAGAVSENTGIGEVVGAATEGIGQVSEIAERAGNLDLGSLADVAGVAQEATGLDLEGLASGAADVAQEGLGGILGGLFGR